MLYTVKTITSAKENKLIEQQNNFLKVKIKKIPEHGKANKELIKFLSKHFKISKSNIEIIKGEKTKNKIIRIDQKK